MRPIERESPSTPADPAQWFVDDVRGTEAFDRRESLAIRSLTPAALALIDARALQRRVDTKYVLPREAFAPLVSACAPDFQVALAEGSSVATYRTVYFDTPDCRFYHAHRRGLRPRHKVRIRHAIERGICALEIKSKDKYDLTRKRRRPHRRSNFELSETDRRFVGDELTGGARLEPTLGVQFRRLTLVGVDAEERLTIDLGLALTSELGTLMHDDVIVAELKRPTWHGAAASPGLHAFRELGARPRRMSKYCIGVAETDLEGRNHRFRPLIRDLRKIEHA